MRIFILSWTSNVFFFSHSKENRRLVFNLTFFCCIPFYRLLISDNNCSFYNIRHWSRCNDSKVNFSSLFFPSSWILFIHLCMCSMSFERILITQWAYQRSLCCFHKRKCKKIYYSSLIAFEINCMVINCLENTLNLSNCYDSSLLLLLRKYEKNLVAVTSEVFGSILIITKKF